MLARLKGLKSVSLCVNMRNVRYDDSSSVINWTEMKMKVADGGIKISD